MPYLLFFILTLISSYSLAEKPQKSLWELGMGIFSMQMPHYLGSDQSYNYTTPLPALVYRGDFFKSDRKGVRSELFQSPNWLLSLSVNGALPVNSEDNKAREGMDDLDPMLEFGPRIQYYFTENQRAKWQLYLDIPLRAAFRFDDVKTRYQGFNSNPALTSDLYSGGLRWSFAIGPQFSDKEFHGYFYNVEEKDVLPDRAYYESHSGYTGLRISTSISYRLNSWRYSAFIRYYNLNNSVNEDSPLLIEPHYASAGLTVFYYLKSSSKMVISR